MMEWMRTIFRTRYSRLRREIAEVEAEVVGKRIEERVSRERFSRVLDVHVRKYKPSALAKSLMWGEDRDG